MAKQRASSTPLTSRSFLPDSVSAMLKKRLTELAGVSIAALAAALALSLMTFNPTDPSANTGTSGLTTNIVGLPGAWVADILMQTIGIAAYAIVFVLFCWGWRIATHRGTSKVWLCVALLPPSLIIWSLSAAALFEGNDWIVPSGYGGFLGAELLRALAALVEGTTLATLPVPSWAFGILFGLMAVPVFVPTTGISWKQWAALVTGIIQPPINALIWVYESLNAHLEGRSKDTNSRAAPTRRKEKAKTKAKKAPASAAKKAKVKREPAKLKQGHRADDEKQPRLDLTPREDGEGGALPPLSLLDEPSPTDLAGPISKNALEQNARMLETVLDDFGIKGEITEVRPGPVITLYELEPAPGTKSSRVIGLADDIARSMSAISVRVAIVPGRNAIGIELPNSTKETVFLSEMLASRNFEKSSSKLALALGKDIGGAPVIADLASMPHLLIAGTTGSGKSVAVNTMILSLIYRMTPKDCRFIMIDPKMLELSVYDGIPHLLTPVVTDPRKAVVALKWAVREMEDRYKAMSRLGVRNLAAYNDRLRDVAAKGETLSRTVQTGFDPDTGEPMYEDQLLDLTPMPLIVVIVDEMADLMMVAGKDVEGSIQRLAQMARAAGIHLIMATQRPSVDVITGTIKANFPTRISFQVTSKIDSRTILGEQGAEQLLGQGDMLYLAAGGRLTRVHGPFVGDTEVEDVVRFLLAQGAPDYVTAVTEEPDGGFDTILDAAGDKGKGSGDALYDQAIALVAREGKASTSFVQRHLQIGYNRAARLIERMEKDGVIGPANHVGKREVLVSDHSS
jgi:DNA segregation ATPase FtsK/SpoIIIE, S-DNA-T family